MVVLWKDFGAARIELGPLDRQAIEDLLLAVLGGPVDTVSLRQLAERSLGDPLFLHELVVGALESGSLRDEGEIWRLRGPLHPTARLVELVTTRLGTLSDPERHALELTALGEPLAQPALDQLAEAEAIASLEDRGLLTSRMDGRRLQVCLAHPVYGDVVRAGISPRRQRVLARELAEASGDRRQDDTLLLRVTSPRGRRRERGPPGGRGQGSTRAPRLRARRTHGACRRRRWGGVRGTTPGRRSGPHERTTRASRSELDALETYATDTAERVQVALLRFDHQVLLRGIADANMLDALLALDLIRYGVKSSRHGGCASRPAPGSCGRHHAPWNLCRRQPGKPRTSQDALLGDCLTRSRSDGSGPDLPRPTIRPHCPPGFHGARRTLEPIRRSCTGPDRPRPPRRGRNAAGRGTRGAGDV